MKIKIIEDLAKIVKGYDNLISILLMILSMIMIIGVLRYQFLIKTFDNMCFYEYSKDYICSCSKFALKSP
jgi:hypothetical protein